MYLAAYRKLQMKKRFLRIVLSVVTIKRFMGGL